MVLYINFYGLPKTNKYSLSKILNNYFKKSSSLKTSVYNIVSDIEYTDKSKLGLFYRNELAKMEKQMHIFEQDNIDIVFLADGAYSYFLYDVINKNIEEGAYSGRFIINFLQLFKKRNVKSFFLFDLIDERVYVDVDADQMEKSIFYQYLPYIYRSRNTMKLSGTKMSILELKRINMLLEEAYENSRIMHDAQRIPFMPIDQQALIALYRILCFFETRNIDIDLLYSECIDEQNEIVDNDYGR